MILDASTEILGLEQKIRFLLTGDFLHVPQSIKRFSYGQRAWLNTDVSICADISNRELDYIFNE